MKKIKGLMSTAQASHQPRKCWPRLTAWSGTRRRRRRRGRVRCGRAAPTHWQNDNVRLAKGRNVRTCAHAERAHGTHACTVHTAPRNRTCCLPAAVRATTPEIRWLWHKVHKMRIFGSLQFNGLCRFVRVSSRIRCLIDCSPETK